MHASKSSVAYTKEEIDVNSQYTNTLPHKSVLCAPYIIPIYSRMSSGDVQESAKTPAQHSHISRVSNTYSRDTHTSHLCSIKNENTMFPWVI